VSLLLYINALISGTTQKPNNQLIYFINGKYKHPIELNPTTK
jgi:hypothetical protein